MNEDIVYKLINGHILEAIFASIGLLASYVFRKTIASMIISFKDRFKFSVDLESDSRKLKSLEHHDIFRTIDRVKRVCRRHKFYHNEGIDNTKTSMFKDFMTFKLDSIKVEFKKLVADSQKAKDNEHLKSMCFDAVIITTQNYLNKTKVHFLENGISVKDADYVINLFEEWRMETITSVQNRINSVFSSKYHKTRYENLLAVLELISMAIDLIPKDGIGAFNSFNGKFKNIEYKNK